MYMAPNIGLKFHKSSQIDLSYTQLLHIL